MIPVNVQRCTTGMGIYVHPVSTSYIKQNIILNLKNITMVNYSVLIQLRNIAVLDNMYNAGCMRFVI